MHNHTLETNTALQPDETFGPANATLDVVIQTDTIGWSPGWYFSPPPSPDPSSYPSRARQRPALHDIDRGTTPWARYNRSQALESELFSQLLSELVARVPVQPSQTRGRGRPPADIRDVIYCAVVKVYHQKSARRSSGTFARAEASGYISKAPQYNAISRLLLREDLTDVLRGLILKSASPLNGIERDFAIDATGIRTTTFMPYNQNKHRVGKKKRTHRYLKLHACSGVITNVISDAIVTASFGKGTGDVSNFEPLIRRTAEGFDVREVSADKAYSSRPNHNAAEDVGAIAYIPFKDIARRQARRSGAWKRAFHLFKAHQDDFYDHYHKRSNVESTFGSFKRKFGDTVLSRNLTAQRNEVLTKVIAYNITMVVRAMFQLGVDPVFGGPHGGKT